ncbi:hypothetical protein [Nitrosomonas sp. Nm34]|nr:hypothetical protein [Nitrosomonas sp. Nm34]
MLTLLIEEEEEEEEEEKLLITSMGLFHFQIKHSAQASRRQYQ